MDGPPDEAARLTCFLVDDQLMLNGKMQDAITRYGGPAPVALWLAGATACGAGNTEGVVVPGLVPAMARSLIILEVDAVVAALVDARMWHDTKSLRRCAACKEHLKGNGIKLPAGGFLFHDWGRQQFNRQEAKDPVARSSKNRKRQMHRMPDLTEAVRARDGEYCRYCAVKVDFRARTGPRAGTYDHVVPDCYEPDGGNFLDALVVACAHCNGEKGHRTPEEWVRDGGLTLLPVPDRRAGNPDLRVRTGSGPGQDGASSGPGLTGTHT